MKRLTILLVVVALAPALTDAAPGYCAALGCRDMPTIPFAAAGIGVTPPVMTRIYDRGYNGFTPDGYWNYLYAQSWFVFRNRSGTKTTSKAFWARASAHIDYLQGGAVVVSWNVEPAICVGGVEPQGGWNTCAPHVLNRGRPRISAIVIPGTASVQGGMGGASSVFANATLRVCHQELCQETALQFVARIVL